VYTYVDPGEVQITDPLGATSIVRSGHDGELLEFVDALGKVTKYSYGQDTAMSGAVGPDGTTTRYEYDSKLNVRRITDALGYSVLFGWTPDFNRLNWMKDQRGNVTTYLTDPKGNTTEIHYPDPALPPRTATYDAAGNVTSTTNRRGQTITYAYDLEGRLVQKVYPGGRTMIYAYDSRGNMTTASDTETGTITMEYDPQDRMTRIEYPDGKWLGFAYDAAGKRTQRTSHDGFTLNYLYDSVGRLSGLRDGANVPIIDYEYDAAGRLSREDKANGTYTTYAYDLSGQVESIVLHGPANEVQERFDYTYDDQGRRTSMSTLTETTTYVYDASGQLVGVSFPDGRQITYQYDAAGNRVAVTDDDIPESYTTNNMNQYTEVGPTTYGYDADGNMTSKVDALGTSAYSYDTENRLVHVATATQGSWDYTYDALGNRRIVAHGSLTSRYAHDPIKLMDVATEYDGSGSLVAQYLNGLGLVARVTASGATGWYGFDALWSTAQVTDDSGSVANSYAYEPFGKTTSSTESVPNVFEFVGATGVLAEPYGLSYMRARYYDPQMGRFLSEDPIGISNDTNLYRYVRNNPTRFADPSGLTYIEPGDRGPFPGGGCTSQSQCDFECKFGLSVAGGLIGIAGVAAGGSAGLAIGVADLAADQVTNWIDICGKVCSDKPKKCPPPPPPPPPNPDPPCSGCDPTDVDPHEEWWSGDPNEKLGPSGYGPQQFTTGVAAMPYTIYFENQPTASAPAQEIVITDLLDSDLDPATVELGEISFGSQFVADLNGLASGSVSVPILNSSYLAEITVSNNGSGQLEWRLKTIDPLTGDFPEDPYAGILPPNDETGRGEGHVTFKVRPKSGLTTGTQIANSASITFDINAPIVTNTWSNTIDNGAPATAVTTIVPAPDGGLNDWDVFWTGGDDSGGSGLKDYTVFVSTDGGTYTAWQLNTTATSGRFSAACGHTYDFYSSGRDNVGNLEAEPATSDRRLDPGGDADLDLVCDLRDNCPSTYNPSQEDTNGNGAGDACDGNPRVTVSANPGDPTDYHSIQDAVDGATQSGTIVEISAGNYGETVIVDETKSFTFVGESGGAEVVVNGGAGPAFDVRSTAGSNAVVFENLTIEGAAGIRSAVGSRITDVKFRSISGIALELLSGSHQADRLTFGPGVGDGVRVASGARLDLRRGWWDAVSGTGVAAEGEVHLVNVRLVQGGTAIRTGSVGFLDVRFATIADNAVGVNGTAGGTATVDHSVVHGNAGGDLLGVACTGVTFTDAGSPNCAGQNGNISDPPGFDAGYRLAAGSPCLDAGDLPQLYNGQPPVDLDGGLRIRDWDGDGSARADLGAYEEANPALSPAEVANLRWTSKAAFGWDAVAGTTGYHLYRGNLRGTVEVLSYAYFGTCRDDLDSNREDTSFSDVAVPDPGAGWFFLVTAENSSASDPKAKEGTLGFGKAAERSNFGACTP
jgi:RHS repeat-associated protein